MKIINSSRKCMLDLLEMVFAWARIVEHIPDTNESNDETDEGSMKDGGPIVHKM